MNDASSDTTSHVLDIDNAPPLTESGNAKSKFRFSYHEGSSTSEPLSEIIHIPPIENHAFDESLHGISEDRKKQRTENSWNDQICVLVKVSSEKIAGLRWLHYESARFLNAQGNFFTFSSITVSALTGFAIASDIGSDPIVLYVLAGLNMTSALLGSLQKFLRSNERAESHRLSAQGYATLYRHIVAELALPRAERNEESKKMINKITSEMDRMQNQSNEIPSNIIKDFRERFKDLAHKPDEANGLHDLANKKISIVDRMLGIKKDSFNHP